MSQEKDILFIEKYFESNLSETEKDLFNDRLEHDDDFKALVEKEKILMAGLRHKALTQSLEGLKSLEKSLSEKPLPSLKPSGKLWYYAVAASVTIVLILSFWLLRPSSKTPDELFQAYYKSYPNVFEPTLRGSDKATQREEAFQAYDRGDHEIAARLFEQLLQEKQDSGILLLLSNAYMNLGNTRKAKENLQVLFNEYDDLDTQATWYLSLCYLKEADLNETRKLLAELSESGTSYAPGAKELLEKIK